jgi:hypothetical protein
MSAVEFFEDDAPARRLTYLCGLLLVVVPFVQVGVQLWPLRLDNIQWRFGAANALSSVLLLPYLGLSLAALLARMTGSRGVGIAVGAVASVFTLGLVASLGLFVLDAQELKAIVQDQAMQSFEGTTLRVMTVTALFVVAFAMLAVVAFLARGSGGAIRATGRSKGSPSREEGVGLIVGQPISSAE